MTSHGLLQSAPTVVVGEVVAPSAPTVADVFFNGDQGLVSVWDFDYDMIIDFQTQFQWAVVKFTPIPMWCSCLCCYPCFLEKNVQWKTRAQHVALTIDGIRYVQDKHPTCCGLSCTDRGRESKTVPYDKITDCDVKEPAGTACCCCVQNVLSTVHVDTASSGSKDGVTSHELSLKGLKYANEFKQAVWGMKRAQQKNAPIGAVAGQSSAPNQEQMSSGLLLEIRDELRDLNKHLREKA